MRIGDKQRKGYSIECFEDAFKRYIPLIPPVSSVPMYQCNNINDLDEKQGVPKEISGILCYRQNIKLSTSGIQKRGKK